jgi:N-acetylmuramoyl-L-alanine amidase CwlA
MTPTTITIHNTGNPTSTAQNERSWLTNPVNNRTASYHIVIDEREAIECIPLNESSWASGDGSSPNSGNRTSIQVEICESGNYQKTIDNAVDLVAKILKERNWDVTKLRRHWDWSRKICPRLMYDQGNWKPWETFKNKVQGKLGESNMNTQETTIQALNKRIEALESLNAMSPPEWAKVAVESAVKSGLINTPNGGSYDFYRIITILHRKGLL